MTMERSLKLRTWACNGDFWDRSYKSGLRAGVIADMDFDIVPVLSRLTQL